MLSPPPGMTVTYICSLFLHGFLQQTPSQGPVTDTKEHATDKARPCTREPPAFRGPSFASQVLEIQTRPLSNAPSGKVAFPDPALGYL